MKPSEGVSLAAVREKIVPIRLTQRERKRAERIAEKFGISLAAAFRMGMHRLYDDLFPEAKRPDHDNG